MSEADSNTSRVELSASPIDVSKALDRVAETEQLDERDVGITIGKGIDPPYPPHYLAALQELNGTHGISISKKSQREVGFGLEIVEHERANDPDRGEGTEHETAEEFWFGRDTIWKIGPTGTPAASPTEVFEQARQDYHGIGWLALELIYTADDQLAGLAHLPAKTVRVRKDTSDSDRTAGHGYVQKRNGQTMFFAEAGDRHQTDVNGDANPVYVDKVSGEVHDDGRPQNPANEVLFIPNPHPNALYYGIPSWVSEIETMVGDHEARRFNRQFFEWDSMGQYFVVVEGGKVSDGAREEIRQMVEGMRDKEGRRVATLDAEELSENAGFGDDPPRIRLEQLQQFGEEDQAFTEYRERNEHDIAKVHEVPPQLIGVMGDSNRSNITESIRDFTKEVIEPAQEKFASRIYRIIHQQVLDVDDWTINFVTKGAENEKQDAEIAAQTVDAVGDALTVKQALGKFGMEPADETIGEMLLSEVGGGGGMLEQLVEEQVDERVGDARDQLETEELIQTGAQADD